jgi:hypothetical protein
MNPCKQCLVEASCKTPCEAHEVFIDQVLKSYGVHTLTPSIISVLVRKNNNGTCAVFDINMWPLGMVIKNGTIIEWYHPETGITHTHG